MAELKIVLPERAQRSFKHFRGDFGSFGNIGNEILEDADFSKLHKEFYLLLDIYEDYLLQDLMNFSHEAAEFRAGTLGEDYVNNIGRRDGLRRLGFDTASDVFDDYLKLVKRVADDAAQFPRLEHTELAHLQPELTNLDERMIKVAKGLSREDIAAEAARAYGIEFRSLSETIRYWLELVRNSQAYRKKLAEAQTLLKMEFSNCLPQQVAELQQGGVNWCFRLFEFATHGEEPEILMLWETNKGAIGLPFYPKEAVGTLVFLWPDEVPFRRI